MRVAVLGAGAIGCTLGALLHLRGQAEVTLVARGAHLEALAKRGLHLEGLEGAHHLALPAAPRVPPGADLVLVATKTQDLDAALAANAAAIGDATVVTTLNGLAAEAIAARHVPAAQVVGCVCTIGATFLEPGRVQVSELGGLVLGQPGRAAGDRARAAARLFARAGLPATLTDNLLGARWTKLAVNSNNALPAALGRSVQDTYADPRVPPFAARVLRETLVVARAEGARLEPLPWASLPVLRAVAALPPRLGGVLLAARVRRLFRGPPVLPSTLQSLRRGKPTEVAFLNGEVVARGRARGVPTPANAALLAAVQRIEAGGPFLSVEQLLVLA